MPTEKEIKPKYINLKEMSFYSFEGTGKWTTKDNVQQFLANKLNNIKEKLCLNKTFCGTKKKGYYWECRNCEIIRKGFIGK